MKNLAIRETAKSANVRLWEVAEKLGLRDDAFSRKLRHELPRDEREKLLGIIAEIKGERERG